MIAVHDEACLVVAVEALERNWEAMIEMTLSLCSAQETIIRTVGLGYTSRVDRVFEPYS